MLQQTTVATVIPRYSQWLREFPDVHALAGASPQRVMKAWEGLGYYARARNLHATAKTVVRDFGGRFPESEDQLLSLPGFGSYTAAAVAAFAFDRPTAVIDANVERVLARVLNLDVAVDTRAGRERVCEAATELLPVRSGGCRFASALMEVGAVVCRPGAVACDSCPLAEDCRATDPLALPRKRPKPPRVGVIDRRVFSLCGGRLALVPSAGPWWKGLHVLPEAGEGGEVIHVSNYAVTRHRVRLEVVRGATPGSIRRYPLDDLPALPSPHARAVAAILNRLHNNG